MGKSEHEAGLRGSEEITDEQLDHFLEIVLGWFEDFGRDFPWRHRSASVYHRVVTEILLQRTTSEAVAREYPVFFARFPSWSAIVEAGTGEVEAALRPLGLWRRRARALGALAVEMESRGGRFPLGRRELEQLPAVGQYVANSIGLFCENYPRPLLDASMARVLERYFGPRRLADIRYDPYLQDLSKRLIGRAARPVEANWAILDFAAVVCRRRQPGCELCPLGGRCRYRWARRENEH